jgi:hypothetical protein
MASAEVERLINKIKLKKILSEFPEPDRDWYNNTKPCKWDCLLKNRAGLACPMK